MADISVTYTFTNGTTADGTQVNTNFTDIINGTSDGTKDLTVFAITASGAVSFNGNVTIGNASGDDLTVNASLASSIPVKTNASFDIGSSTLGIQTLYLGSSGSFTTGIDTAATASYVFTLPATAGTDGYVLRNTGSGNTQFHLMQDRGLNYGLALSVGSSALTIALKGADGNDPSSTNKVSMEFRNETLATGTSEVGSASGATSLVISSGSTLGHSDATEDDIFVYAINNSGTIELAVSSENVFDEAVRHTTTTEGGGGAADSRDVLYSTTARTDKAIRLIGRLKSTQTTAGTWAAVPTNAGLFNSEANFIGKYEVVGYVGNGYGSTNTQARRFTNSSESGTGATYADSSTLGASVTFDRAMKISVSYADGTNSGSKFGVFKNPTNGALTTAMSSLTNAGFTSDGQLGFNQPNATQANSVAVSTSVKPGDVIYFISETSNANTDARTWFRLTEV